MMKFRRSAKSGSYSVNPPSLEDTGEVAAPTKDSKGRYTLTNRESLNFHKSPVDTFRSSVRRSLQKLRKKREKRQGKEEKDPVVGGKEKQGKRGKYEINISYSRDNLADKKYASISKSNLYNKERATSSLDVSRSVVPNTSKQFYSQLYLNSNQIDDDINDDEDVDNDDHYAEHDVDVEHLEAHDDDDATDNVELLKVEHLDLDQLDCVKKVGNKTKSDMHDNEVKERADSAIVDEIVRGKYEGVTLRHPRKYTKLGRSAESIGQKPHDDAPPSKDYKKEPRGPLADLYRKSLASSSQSLTRSKSNLSLEKGSSKNISCNSISRSSSSSSCFSSDNASCIIIKKKSISRNKNDLQTRTTTAEINSSCLTKLKSNSCSIANSINAEKNSCSVEKHIVHSEQDDNVIQVEKINTVSCTEDEPFNTKEDEPFNTKEDEPFNTKKDEPFNTEEDIQELKRKKSSYVSVVEKAKSPALVIHPRRSEREAELELNLGDIVFLHRRLSADWYYGERHGVMGIIPAKFIKTLAYGDDGEEKVRAVAKLRYQARTDRELSLEVGQLVYLIHRLDYHWYTGHSLGSVGLVPAAYLEVLSSTQDGGLPPIPVWFDRHSQQCEDIDRIEVVDEDQARREERETEREKEKEREKLHRIRERERRIIYSDRRRRSFVVTEPTTVFV